MFSRRPRKRVFAKMGIRTRVIRSVCSMESCLPVGWRRARVQSEISSATSLLIRVHLFRGKCCWAKRCLIRAFPVCPPSQRRRGCTRRHVPMSSAWRACSSGESSVVAAGGLGCCGRRGRCDRDAVPLHDFRQKRALARHLVFGQVALGLQVVDEGAVDLNLQASGGVNPLGHGVFQASDQMCQLLFDLALCHSRGALPIDL